MSVIPDVENRLYGGRALLGFTVEGAYVASWPELTYESLGRSTTSPAMGPSRRRPSTGSSAN